MFPVIEEHLLAQLTDSNCHELFELSHEFELHLLQRQAAEKYLAQSPLLEETNLLMIELVSSENLRQEIETGRKVSLSKSARQYLREVEKEMHFNLLQVGLRRRR